MASPDSGSPWSWAVEVQAEGGRQGGDEWDGRRLRVALPRGWLCTVSLRVQQTGFGLESECRAATGCDTCTWHKKHTRAQG